jgi:threonine synthase
LFFIFSSLVYICLLPLQKGIFLETAHPVKFYDVVEPVLNQSIPLPDAVIEMIDLPKKSTVMDVSFEALKDFY